MCFNLDCFSDAVGRTSKDAGEEQCPQVRLDGPLERIRLETSSHSAAQNRPNDGFRKLTERELYTAGGTSGTPRK